MARMDSLTSLVNQVLQIGEDVTARYSSREIGGFTFKGKKGVVNLVPRVGIVKHVDIDNWRVQVTRIGSRAIEFVNLTADSGSIYNYNGGFPEIGDFCLYVKILANNMGFANQVVLKFLPSQHLNAEDYKLIDSWIPGFPLHPFKPALISGNYINSSTQGSSITLTDNIDLISRDSQRFWFDSIAHQSFLFTPHYTQAGGGLLKFQGGILLNAYQDSGAPEDTAVKLKDGRFLNYYVTSDDDKYIKFDGTSDETASLTEDSTLLYEYGDYLNPLTDMQNLFKYEPVKSDTGIKYLYGSGTFRELLGDDKNKILKTVLYEDSSTSNDSSKFDLDISFTEVATDKINTESLAFWKIIDNGDDRKFTTIDKYGRMFISLGIDEDDTALKRSLDMVTEGGIKLNIGADDEDHSLHVLFNGKSHIRLATDSHSNDIKFTDSQINIELDDDENQVMNFERTDSDMEFTIKLSSTVFMTFNKTNGKCIVTYGGDSGYPRMVIDSQTGNTVFEVAKDATHHYKLDSSGNAVINNGTQGKYAARTGDIVTSNAAIDPNFWSIFYSHTHPQAPTGPGSPSPQLAGITKLESKITEGSNSCFIGDTGKGVILPA